jgi:hypothetical protein
MDVLVIVHHHCQNEPGKLHPHHQCKGLFIINPWLLDIPINDKPRFVLDNTAVFILL